MSHAENHHSHKVEIQQVALLSANLSGHAWGGHSVELSRGARKRQHEQGSETHPVEYGPQVASRDFHGILPRPFTCGDPIRLEPNRLKNLQRLYPMLHALQHKGLLKSRMQGVAEHDALDRVARFLHSLAESEWHHRGD